MQKRKTLLYSLLFFITLFIQCVGFHYLAFHYYIGSSIISNPVKFQAFYLPKISICLFIASFVPLFKKKGWTIAVSAIITIWVLAELVYYRINGFLLDAFSFTMVGNMNGFWSSVFAFIRPADIALIFPTLALVIFFIWLKPIYVSRPFTAAALCLSAILHITGAIMMKKQESGSAGIGIKECAEFQYNPFSSNGSIEFNAFSPNEYAKTTSVIHCLVYDIWNLAKLPFQSREIIVPDDFDTDSVEPLFNTTTTRIPEPETPLYIILFESLESWSVTPQATPAIYNFIQSHSNILWAKRVTKQTRAGTSADGQMIINTGILPVSSGAVCFRFPGNRYPSLSELYENSALIIPGDISVWNQKGMSAAYGIKDNFVVPESNDSITFSILTDIHKNYPYVMALSIASHTPFNNCPKDKIMNWNSSMPKVMSNYLNCVHYTDSCLEQFLKLVDTDDTLRNSTIVITGDHTIFDRELRNEFNEFCISEGEDYSGIEEFCPFIMYSPSIQEKTIIEDVVYQMDIFPTALHAIGCDSTYYWKGFGIDIADKTAVRLFLEKDAFVLSEKMIESDYWRHRKDALPR